MRIEHVYDVLREAQARHWPIDIVWEDPKLGLFGITGFYVLEVTPFQFSYGNLQKPEVKIGRIEPVSPTVQDPRARDGTEVHVWIQIGTIQDVRIDESAF